MRVYHTFHVSPPVRLDCVWRHYIRYFILVLIPSILIFLTLLSDVYFVVILYYTHSSTPQDLSCNANCWVSRTRRPTITPNGCWTGWRTFRARNPSNGCMPLAIIPYLVPVSITLIYPKGIMFGACRCERSQRQRLDIYFDANRLLPEHRGQRSRQSRQTRVSVCCRYWSQQAIPGRLLK